MDRPLIPESQKQSYQALTEICLPHHTQKQFVLNFIDQLQNYDNDEDDNR